jgi:hypothetical protein
MSIDIPLNLVLYLQADVRCIMHVLKIRYDGATVTSTGVSLAVAATQMRWYSASKRLAAGTGSITGSRPLC